MFRSALFVLSCFAAAVPASAAKLNLPTSNQSVFKTSEQSKYFAGTVGRSWESGTFGCVRSSGYQMHEGIDIRFTQKDKSGEPLDRILATAAGKVAYINRRASLSNYGNYIILQHYIDGLEIYSLYAHLSQIREDLKVGQLIKSGEIIATMGRTTNTREKIGKDRAHLHFELNFFINQDFGAWYKKAFPGQRNDHGLWNGQNMIGIDPQQVLLVSQRQGSEFNLLSWVQSQRELCRVIVRRTDFPWIKRYAPLLRRNPVAEREGVAGYELALNFNGLPFSVIPRAASELKSKAKYQLISVSEKEYNQKPCRKLITRKGKTWELSSSGIRLLDLITF